MDDIKRGQTDYSRMELIIGGSFRGWVRINIRLGPVLGVAILKSCSKIIPTKQYSPRTSLFPLFVVAL